MKQNITALAVGAALALASANSSAQSWFQFEAGLGVTSAQKVGDGIYYSRGFSHDTPNGSYGGRVGVVVNLVDAPARSFTPGVRLHVDYYNFGKVRWSSMNPQDEADFTSIGQQGGYNVKTGTCIDNNCGVFRKFDSTGGIQAIAFTVEPYWNVGGAWQLGIEGGPALFRSTWTSVATALSDGRFGPAGTQEALQHQPKIQLGAIAGVDLFRGPVGMQVAYLYAPAAYRRDSSDVPAGIKGELMLTLGYRF